MGNDYDVLAKSLQNREVKSHMTISERLEFISDRTDIEALESIKILHDHHGVLDYYRSTSVLWVEITTISYCFEISAKNFLRPGLRTSSGA